MASIVLMPKLGLTMERGFIVKWLKNEGDSIQKGDGLIEVESDKSTVEVDAQYSGVLMKIYHHAGEEVPCGTAIAVIGAQGEEVADISVVDGSARRKRQGARETTAQVAGSSQAEPVGSLTEQSPSGGRIVASPRARRYARQQGIELAKVGIGSGPGGRIEEKDVRRYEEQTNQSSRRIRPLAKSISELKEVDPEGTQECSEGGRILREDVESVWAHRTGLVKQEGESQPDRIEIPLSRMRGRIADRLSASVTSTPHFYLSLSINMENMLAMREEINRLREEAKISITSMLVKIVGFLMKSYPWMNLRWFEDRIILHNAVDVAVAVSTGEGLLAPVLRNCQCKSLRQIDTELKVLISKAKQGNLQQNDYQNPTFTISNLGMYGIESFTAIINPPASVILSVGRILEKPIVSRGEVVVKPIMQATLGCDHRVIDGATAAPFLTALKETIENPLRILLEYGN